MKHDDLGVATCRYGASRLLFRGPARALDGRHVAFVGGSATHGAGVGRPLPALVEEALGEVCVNLGQANASVDAFLHEPEVGAACRAARMTVVEVMGAQNLSNRLYRVHPRRNDRFTGASELFEALFPGVDLAEVCFTRHLVAKVREEAPERFGLLVEELQAAWVARMRSFLQMVGPRVVLLWLGPEPPPDAPWGAEEGDPLFVTRGMVEGLRPLVREVVAAAAPEGAAAAVAGAVRACP